MTVRDGAQNVHHQPWCTQIGDDASDEWLPQWRHDPAWPTPFSVAVSVRPDQLYHFVHLLQYTPHTVISWIQIWLIRGHSWNCQNFGVSFSNNSVAQHVRDEMVFQVSHGSVKTLSRAEGKRLHYFAANLCGKRCTEVHQNRQIEFYRRNYQKTFWSFFLDAV